MIPRPRFSVRASRPGRGLGWLDATGKVVVGPFELELSVNLDPDALFLPRPFLWRDNPEMLGVRCGSKTTDSLVTVCAYWRYPEPE